MSMFKEMLGADETLFRNHIALDYDYVPKLIPYRENEQKHIASCIKPLLQGRNGRNLIITGKPGIGKTVACKHVLQELEEETDEIIPIYVNCWQRNTTFKIILALCEFLGYKLTHNKKTDELFKIVKQILNKKAAVFVFDEIDKAEEFDFLYILLEEIYRKSVFLITNYKEWTSQLDARIKSRLTPEMTEFKPYSIKETEGILKQRLDVAFYPKAWEQNAFASVVKKTTEAEDIRIGLYLLKEAGNSAEDCSSRKIKNEHVEKAVQKLGEFSIKDKNKLEDETKLILEIIKANSGKKIGNLFKIYQEEGGSSVYKTFQRKIKKLADNSFIKVTKTGGGAEGSTTIIESTGTKRLTEF